WPQWQVPWGCPHGLRDTDIYKSPWCTRIPPKRVQHVAADLLGVERWPGLCRHLCHFQKLVSVKGSVKSHDVIVGISEADGNFSLDSLSKGCFTKADCNICPWYGGNTMQPVPPPSPDLATVSAADWAEAQRREAVIRPLAERALCSVAHAEAAAQVLGLSSRRIYMLIRAYRASGGLLTSLIPGRSQGGPGKSRLSSAVDRIIRDAIEAVYLTRQKAPVSRVVEDVRRRCWHANVSPPSGNTIRQRIRTLPVHETLTRREGAKAARAKTRPVYGQSPESPYPLAVVQMDHTPVDLIVVDEASREPIGRPYLTLAIDVFSRCIAGMCLSLEAPSAVSVGL